MKTKRLTEQETGEAARLIAEGQLVAIPTETVYGLGANGLLPEAVEQIFKAKGRPQDNPLILHVPSDQWLARYCCEIPEEAYALTKHFWPGPLTLILKRQSMVPDCVTAGLETVGMRCPAHPVTRAILVDYNKDIDKSLIGPEYLPAWEKFGLFGLKCKNDSPSIRAYSMANYPAEGDRIMLTVRIATPPFKPKPQVGFMDVMPGIASSYIFTLKPGDKVIMSGPYGDFHPIFDSNKEMMWIGGGAGMAPLRAQIMHLTKTLHTTDRKMSYFYGARALNEVFYLEDFLQIEKDFPNFTFHLALDRPDPAADAAGVKYTPGFVHNVIYETYLKNHEAPEDIEYYMCGPGPMSKAVEKMLDDLGVPAQNLMFDNFGG